MMGNQNQPEHRSTAQSLEKDTCPSGRPTVLQWLRRALQAINRKLRSRGKA